MRNEVNDRGNLFSVEEYLTAPLVINGFTIDSLAMVIRIMKTAQNKPDSKFKFR